MTDNERNKVTNIREERIWVEKAQKGNEKAFVFLLNQYHDKVFRLIISMVRHHEDSNDLTIETFTKAFHKIETYTPYYPFGTWLSKIARNKALDYLRKKQLPSTPIDLKENDLASNDLTPEEEFIKSQREKISRDIIKTLKPKYRNVIALRYFNELSYKEIAEEMNTPIGSVKTHLYRAKDLLLNIYKSKKYEI